MTTSRFDQPPAATKRLWTIKRTTAEVNFYDGIEAESAEEAVQKFYEGEGEIDMERTEYPERHVEAVEVEA